MKRSSYILLSLALITGLAFAGYEYTNERSQKKDRVILEIVHNTLAVNHLSPKNIDNELSSEAFDLYLESLDQTKRFLLKEDVDALTPYREKLDEEFKNYDLTFFDLSQEILQKRLREAEKICMKLLDKPFDLYVDEAYESDPEKMDFASDKKQLRDHWRLYLKHRVLSRVHDKYRQQQSKAEKDKKNRMEMESANEEVFAPDEDIEGETMAEWEEQARKREREVHEEWFKNIKDMEHIDWLGVYLNAFTTVFDPHTEYFPPKQREDFEIEMTGQLEGIGAQLSKRSTYITVEKIVSGSAAWRQGELEVGDKILAVAQGSEEPVDIVGMTIQKAVKLIRGKKGTEVRLTVEKRDGSTVVIPIIRDVVEIESTFARSAILGEKEKVGYIRLPKFYVDFYSSENHNCAIDVKEELIKLKAEGVKSVILDLRNNGGGSLQGVVDMVGLFIESGPVVQVQSSLQGKKIYRATDNKVYWDGPLVVMVNEFSASASEIFAAAIKDYNRGLIVGSEHTYGKGTVQNMVDLDRMIRSGLNDIKPLGALKLTIQKYYGIDGGTPQLNGVTPHVVLPSTYRYIKLGEREQPHALAADRITAATFTPWIKHEAAQKSAISNAVNRVAVDSSFQKIDDYARIIAQEREETKVNLHFDKYEAHQAQRRKRNERYKDLSRAGDSTAVFSIKAQLEIFETDSVKKHEYKQWHKGLSRDLYLREAKRIAQDVASVQ